MSNLKKRIGYAAALAVIVFIEVMIALYVHDRFIRPYVGDVLVVAAVYCFLRVFVPEKCQMLPLFVFIFAVGVEVLQYFDLVGMLGLENSRFFQILLGSVFDIGDIACYAVGCVLLGVYELLRINYGKRKN